MLSSLGLNDISNQEKLAPKDSYRVGDSMAKIRSYPVSDSETLPQFSLKPLEKMNCQYSEYGSDDRGGFIHVCDGANRPQATKEMHRNSTNQDGNDNDFD